MWNFLYKLASPKYYFNLSNKIIPIVTILATLSIAIAFIWGLGLAPRDYQQGDAFRLIYIHVPAAFLSMALYGFMSFLSILLLVWRIKLAGIFIKATAKTGAWFALLALITGSIWGKPMWGAWWVWDARLTSELILLVIYFAIIAVISAINDNKKSDNVAAIITLVGLIDLPIIHYSVYWWNTLHQGSTILVLGKPKIHSSMLYPLLLALFGFVSFAITIILMRANNEVLWREKRQSWVKQLMEESKI